MNNLENIKTIDNNFLKIKRANSSDKSEVIYLYKKNDFGEEDRQIISNRIREKLITEFPALKATDEVSFFNSRRIDYWVTGIPFLVIEERFFIGGSPRERLTSHYQYGLNKVTSVAFNPNAIKTFLDAMGVVKLSLEKIEAICELSKILNRGVTFPLVDNGSLSHINSYPIVG